MLKPGDLITYKPNLTSYHIFPKNEKFLLIATKTDDSKNQSMILLSLRDIKLVTLHRYNYLLETSFKKCEKCEP